MNDPLMPYKTFFGVGTIVCTVLVICMYFYMNRKELRQIMKEVTIKEIKEFLKGKLKWKKI